MSYTREEVESVQTLLCEILNAVVSVFEQAEVDLPERRYIVAGSPAVDCPGQLTVSLSQLYLGGPGEQEQLPQRCDAIRTASIEVAIVRCLPMAAGGARSRAGGGALAPEVLSEVAGQQCIDAYMLLEASRHFPDPLNYGFLADVVVGEPQGGAQAVLLNLAIVVP